MTFGAAKKASAPGQMGVEDPVSYTHLSSFSRGLGISPPAFEGTSDADTGCIPIRELIAEAPA